MPDQKNGNHPSGDRSGVAEKLLILGLDGATWDVLDPLMDTGRMPNLKRLVDGGTRGTLLSTVPPITPSAWTTMMTGRSPGNHGIIDFERYDVHTNHLTFNTTNALQRVRTIWRTLGDRGLRVGCINIPMTYPPVKVNGFLISGFEAVSTAAEFAYPPELKQEILQRWPDYTFKNTWRRKTFGGDSLYARNLADISRSFYQGAEVMEYCGDRFGWDVLMIVFKLVDNLQHKIWRYIDSRNRERFAKRCRMAEDCFAELDVVIGRILSYASANGAHVLMLSDHGHGSLDAKVQPNLMLKHWGYLKLREGGAQAQTRARHSVGKLFRKKGRFAAGNFSISEDLAVDFARTQAAVMHAGMAGFLYVNLEGRQETGIVPPSDYERLRDELKSRFEDATCQDRDGRTVPIFEAVHKPEELYGCTRKGREWLPDLLLCPRPGFAVVRKIRGSSDVTWVPLARLEGTHRPEGVWAVRGPGVAAGKRVDSQIIHIAPTVLAMVGVPVPAEMEGAPIAEAFDPKLTFEIDESSSSAEAAPQQQAGEVYTQEEMARLTERLIDLGYLE